MNVTQQTEIDRLREITAGVDWIVDPRDLLYSALRHVDQRYFTRSDRLPAEQLLTPDLKESAKLLDKFVAASELSDICRQRLCGACLKYLEVVCSMSAAELKTFREGSRFDPFAFNLFQDIEPDDGD